MLFHKTLEQLRSLQEIFNERFKIEHKLEELPREVETQEKMVQQLKKEFLVQNEKQMHLKKEIALKQDDLRHVQEKREKLEKEISSVNSQRDYERIDRAIKENEEYESVIMHELSNFESKLSEMRDEFEVSEQFLKSQETELEKIKAKTEHQVLEFKESLQKFKDKETVIGTDLNDNLAFKFERIIRSKGGDGIVPIKKNICHGCYIQLPVHFVNEVRAEDMVLTCPYCFRIVYYDTDDDDRNTPETDISGLQDIVSEDDIEFDDFEPADYEEFMDNDDIGSDAYVPMSDVEGSDEGDDLSDESEGFDDDSEYNEEDELE